MKDFLIAYYKELIVLLCFVIEIVLSLIAIIKKLKGRSSIYEQVLSALPSIIAKVEKAIGQGHGPEKFSMVIDILDKWFVKETGKVMTNSDVVYFSEAIEKILSTPTKKEALDEVKK